MKISNTILEGLFIIEPSVFHDSRGYFFESYSEDKYSKLGIPRLVQFNQSYSKKGVLRGLDYQINPFSQGKLVSVLQGRIQDVSVDLRKNSKTFLKYFSIELSSEDKKQLWIPPGFAHGFLALSDDVIFQYGCSKPYDASSDRGILWNDPQLNIPWKVNENLVLSDKNASLPLLKDVKDFF